MRNIEIIIKPLTGLEDVRRACEMTMHGQTSKVSLRNIYKSEHSPARARLFWVELREIQTFVSVHLVRHNQGVVPYVQTMRDDMYLCSDDPIPNRNTPVNHGMIVNSQALINISRKRLCYKSHAKTVGLWRKFRKEMKKVDPDVADFMVPECVYRNGLCPELKICRPGVDRVVNAKDYAGYCDNFTRAKGK